MAEADWSLWMYDPNFPLAIVACVVYCIIFFAITYITCFKYRAWYFTPVVAGAAIEVAAYISRAYSVKNQQNIVSLVPMKTRPKLTKRQPPFVITLTLTVLAPVFVAAGNYMLISRLILAVLPPSRHRVLKIPGHRLTPIFVVCDIIAFSIQGNGSGVASGGNWQGEKARIGTNILIAGLSFQFVAFSLFLCVLGRFHYLAKQGAAEHAPVGWGKVVSAVYVSSILIMIRCIFRVAEFAEGMGGYAYQNEWLFWTFEALPMGPAIAIFCIFHPSRYLGENGSWRLRRPSKMICVCRSSHPE